MQAAEEGLTRRVQVAEDGRTAGLGGAPVGAVQGPHRRHLFGRARLRLQHRSRRSRRASPSRNAGPIFSNPKLKDEVQVADPNSSGTAYTLLATIVQLMGEDKGFEYLKALHKNVNQYTKSGAAPAKATALGETTIGITFMHDMVTMVVDNAPIKTVAPCEGTGYEIGSMSIIKGAKNLDNAKKFYDWALTPAAQKLGAEAKSYQVPSNKNTPVPPQAPKLAEIKLINFDFAKYGSSAERKRLLVQVGQRGQEPAEIVVASLARPSMPPAAARRSDHAMPGSMLGWIGYADPALALAGSSELGRLRALPGTASASAPAATLVASGLSPAQGSLVASADRWLPLLLHACARLVRARIPRDGGRLARRAGAARPRAIVLQGFTIGLNGWTLDILTALFGHPARARPAWATARR